MTENELTLLHRYLDGAMTPEELESLEKLLRGSLEARATLRSLATIDAKWQQLAAEEVHGERQTPMTEVIQSAGQKGGPTSGPLPNRSGIRLPGWPQQMTAGLVAGVLAGVLGMGIAWSMGSLEAVARDFRITHGDFDTLRLGRIPNRFPEQFGEWCGDPAEVIESADGNRELRFLETANVTGDSNGRASACNVFQLVDLSTLRQQWNIDNAGAQMTLTLSARFRRAAASTDAELPRLRASCTILLFQAEPRSIGREWPHVIRTALASGRKPIRLKPGQEGEIISASCLLEPEANVALISVNVNIMEQTNSPVQLGGYFVDDVGLTVVEQPRLPVRIEQ